MPEGPVEEGSIVAFLKLDDSDFNRKLDEAEQRARDLNHVDPDIRVRADTADAVANLEEARAAAEAVGRDDVIRTTTVNDVRTTETTDRSSRLVETADPSGVDAHAAALVRDADAAGRDADALGTAAAAEDTLNRVVVSDSYHLDKVTAARQAAVAALNAAGSAADRVAVAQRNVADAERMSAEMTEGYASSVDVLNHVRTNEFGRTFNVVQAEQDLADAERAAEAASTALSEAQHDLTGAEAAVADAADGAGKALDKSGRRAGSAGGYYGILAAVIAGLVPLAAELAGYVVGVGGALLGMGTAGVLAVLGVRNEMAAGTVQGQQYSSLMGTLTTDLHTMEDVAASGVLTPFADMVDRVDAAMPQLTSELGGFSRDLGSIGDTVVATLISGFQTLNPLFSQGAQYVQHLADVWARWTAGGGLNQFAADAEQDLPVVAADLGNLLSIAMKVITGLAPFGTTVLEGLQLVTGVLNMLPTPALTGLAVAAAAVFVEFRTWSSIQPIIRGLRGALTAMGVSADLALGPIGFVVAGVAALGVGVAAAAESTQKASQDTQDYTVMLEQTNGVIDQNIRQQVAQKLVTDGTADSARKYGISLSELTTAVVDGGSALDSANAALTKNAASYETVTRNADGSVTVTTNYAGAAGDVKKALDGSHGSFAAAQRDYASIGAASTSAAASQAGFQSQATQVSNALAIQAGFATALTNDLNLMNGISLNQAQAATAQAASINSTTASFKTNGSAILGNTGAAIANQQAIEAAITAIDQHGEAVATATGSQAKGTAAILDGRDALLRQLQAQHELTPAIQTFIDKLTAIPTKRNVDIAVNTVQAENAVNRISNLLAGLQSVKTINVNTVEHTYGVGIAGAAPGHALGGTIGSPSGTVSGAGTALSDSILTWLSNGEEVVSNAHGQASMYRNTLKAINRGVSAPQVAATLGVPNSSPRVVNHYVQHFHITSDNPEAMFQYAAAQTNALAMV